MLRLLNCFHFVSPVALLTSYSPTSTLQASRHIWPLWTWLRWVFYSQGAWNNLQDELDLEMLPSYRTLKHHISYKICFIKDFVYSCHSGQIFIVLYVNVENRLIVLIWLLIKLILWCHFYQVTDNISQETSWWNNWIH